MELYCDNCGKYVNAQPFKRFLDVNKQIITDEYYCPDCLGTIYTREKKLNKEK